MELTACIQKNNYFDWGLKDSLLREHLIGTELPASSGRNNRWRKIAPSFLGVCVSSGPTLSHEIFRPDPGTPI